MTVGAAAAPLVGPYTLPPLPFGYADLAPVIDEATMRLHHGKHHQAYVDATNSLLSAHPQWQGLTIESLLAKLPELPLSIREPLRNNGGGLANHNLFWSSLSPAGHASPPATLVARLNLWFGSFDRFQERFVEAGLKQFGSGWVFLVTDPQQQGELRIMAMPNQDSVIGLGLVPLLACDVWEHAYYLKYNNRRAEWLHSWWQIVNWQGAAERLERAMEISTADRS